MQSELPTNLNWMSKCFICGAPIEGKPDVIRSIVPLEKCPDHAEPEYVHWYPVCIDCMESKELV